MLSVGYACDIIKKSSKLEYHLPSKVNPAWSAASARAEVQVGPGSEWALVQWHKETLRHGFNVPRSTLPGVGFAFLLRPLQQCATSLSGVTLQPISMHV